MQLDTELEPDVPQSTSARMAEAFAKFNDRLKPTYSEPDDAETCLRVIERRLADEFDMLFLAPYGSVGHGTNVDGYSAFDHFAVVPKDRLYEDSGRSVEEMRELLSSHLPEVYLEPGRPVIAVPFGERPSDRHHIAPAFPTGTRGEHDLYGIPGPSQRWIVACPGGHSAWINMLDRRMHYRLKPLVRMVKAWNYCDGRPLWSFYLELSVADFLSRKGPGNYSEDLHQFFTYLLARRLAPFKNTEGSSEPVYATTLSAKFDAMDNIRAALTLAKKACVGERQEIVGDAYFWWRKLFQYQFPPYK